MLGLVARNKGECIRLRTCMCSFRNWHMHIDLLLFQNDMVQFGHYRSWNETGRIRVTFIYLSASYRNKDITKLAVVRVHACGGQQNLTLYC